MSALRHFFALNWSESRRGHPLGIYFDTLQNPSILLHDAIVSENVPCCNLMQIMPAVPLADCFASSCGILGRNCRDVCRSLSLAF